MNASAAAANRSPVPDRRQRLLILAICCFSLFMVGTDSTIVNVALPAIHRSLHASVSGLQWIVDAYTLVLASLLMLSGSTADRLGRRKVFQIGVSLFALGSLACALAPSLGILIAARIVQAIGGSMLNPVALSIVRNVFTDPRERAQAIGIWGGVFGSALALGPVLGGLLIDAISWRAVFIVNVPIAIVAIILTAKFVPESRADRPRRVDAVGQVLVIVGLAALIYGIIEAPTAGWLSGESLAFGGTAAVAFIALIFYEGRTTDPLIELRFFRSAPFAAATALALGVFMIQGGFLFLSTLYLQDARGLSALQAGLYTLPMAIPLLFMAPLTGRFMGAFGTRVPVMGGALCLLAGGLMLTRLSLTTPILYLFGAYVVLGLGMGMLNPPISNAAISGMPAAMAGVAAALTSTSRQAGATLGVAIFGALAGKAAATGIAGAEFPEATHPAWWVVAGVAAMLCAIGYVATTPWARRTAAVTGELIAAEERQTMSVPVPAA